ncbi:MAG: hypothetical protein B6U97_04950 [Candidatus Altiarchaeales archaeon ex4484_96]|nr:MAG: hypothetical protein B6U97_04950 [Candidatus Altiarchaeales archaeon ex4484_96]
MLRRLLFLLVVLFFLSGCAQKQPIESDGLGPEDYDYSITHDELIRYYRIHIPASYEGDATPLVIYVHGGAGNKRSAYVDGMDKMSDKHGFILAAPEGTGEVKLGELRGNWNGGRWETGECCETTDDVGFISAMIDDIRGKFNIDERKVYATGISNGGLMTNRLGCELADKIAAIAPVAPAAIMSDCFPSRPMPVFDVHGSADPANPADGSEPSGIFGEGGLLHMPYKRMSPYQVVDSWKKINNCSEIVQVMLRLCYVWLRGWVILIPVVHSICLLHWLVRFPMIFLLIKSGSFF